MKKYLLLSLLLTAFVGFNNLQIFAQTADVKVLQEKIAPLIEKKNYIEALPLLEQLAAIEPNNAETQFYLGFALMAKTRTVSDKAEIKQLFIKARKAFLKSKELGNNSDLVEAFIEGIPENGEVPGFGETSEADKLMKEAEAFFAQGKMDEALAKYQKAFELDPKNYYAALFSGDVYVTKSDYANAEIWYQKAIAIDPFRETAYRYSATPFMKQKKYERARERYVEAYIVEPFNKLAISGINQWSEATGIALGHPKIDIPANVSSGKNGDVNITLGLKDDNGDGSFAWTAYGLARAKWQSNKNGLSDEFKKAYPNEKTYRHSLAEELDALKTTVTVLKESMASKEKPIKKLHPQLEKLVKLSDDGLLEPYILMVLIDRDIFQDFKPYLTNNREKLRRYVVEYVLTGGGK